jgi:hypothetical protein
MSYPHHQCIYSIMIKDIFVAIWHHKIDFMIMKLLFSYTLHKFIRMNYAMTANFYFNLGLSLNI